MNDSLAVTSRTLLARLLDEPQLVKQVQALAPRALLGLIDHVGLEDPGELVALATVEQLERIQPYERSSLRDGENERRPFDEAARVAIDGLLAAAARLPRSALELWE